jgi:hypothetical protein
LVAEIDAAIGWDALRDRVRVERRRAEHVRAHRQRLERLVALANVDGRRALARFVHAWGVAGTANVER